LRKKVTIISVEKERVIEIRWQGPRREILCEQCGARVRMLTADEAAVVAGVSPSAVCDWVETGRVHFTRDSDGLLLVCLNSIGCLPEGRLIAG
jgi:hypothetical protein